MIRQRYGRFFLSDFVFLIFMCFNRAEGLTNYNVACRRFSVCFYCRLKAGNDCRHTHTHNTYSNVTQCIFFLFYLFPFSSHNRKKIVRMAQKKNKNYLKAVFALKLNKPCDNRRRNDGEREINTEICLQTEKSTDKPLESILNTLLTQI